RPLPAPRARLQRKLPQYTRPAPAWPENSVRPRQLLPPPACTAFRSLSLPKCASLRKHRNDGRARKTNKWRAILLLCYHAFLNFLESALKVVIVGAGIGGL